MEVLGVSYSSHSALSLQNVRGSLKVEKQLSSLRKGRVASRPAN